MEKIELRGAAAGTVAHHLDSLAEVSMRDLQAAVANMAERIASLERERDELAQALRWFNAEVASAEEAVASDTDRPPTKSP